MPVYLDRALILINPTGKYAAWAKAIDDEDGVEAYSEEETGNAYLIGSIISGERQEVRKKLQACWREIADEEFEGWSTDRDMWPTLRSIKDFEEYFQWDFREIVVDLEPKAPLLDEV